MLTHGGGLSLSLNICQAPQSTQSGPANIHQQQAGSLDQGDRGVGLRLSVENISKPSHCTLHSTPQWWLVVEAEVEGFE